MRIGCHNNRCRNQKAGSRVWARRRDKRCLLNGQIPCAVFGVSIAGARWTTAITGICNRNDSIATSSATKRTSMILPQENGTSERDALTSQEFTTSDRLTPSLPPRAIGACHMRARVHGGPNVRTATTYRVKLCQTSGAGGAKRAAQREYRTLPRARPDPSSDLLHEFSGLLLSRWQDTDRRPAG